MRFKIMDIKYIPSLPHACNETREINGVAVAGGLNVEGVLETGDIGKLPWRANCRFFVSFLPIIIIITLTNT